MRKRGNKGQVTEKARRMRPIQSKFNENTCAAEPQFVCCSNAPLFSTTVGRPFPHTNERYLERN